MNAIVALCHFCELHGPAVLFCTRAFAQPDEESNSSDAESRDGRDSGPNSFYCSMECTSTSNLTDSSSVPASPAVDKPKLPVHCEACRSFEDGHSGFISSDVESQVSYISSQYPHQPEVYGIIRKACVRSLSGEVCTGRDCPFFFGDDQGIHVLSQNFSLKDILSRGFQRNYSIIVVMTDKIFLLNSWPFLTKHIHQIIDELKAKADAVYNKESVRYPIRDQRPPTVPLRNHRSYRQIRSNAKPARSLKDLTNDGQVFEYLHKAFTWLLKAGSNRLIERMMEGPPTEESVVDMEKQEETEEGFVKLFYRKDDVIPECSSTPHSDTEDAESKLLPTFEHPRNLLKVLGYAQFHELLCHILIGHQVIVRAQRRNLVHSAIQCLKVFLPKGCCHVVSFTKNYDEWRRCSFVGMSLDVPLPGNLMPSVVLDMREPARKEAADSVGMTRSMFAAQNYSGLDELESYRYSIYSLTNSALPQKMPTVLEKMEKTLLSEDLADCLVEPFLSCLKEEWLNKAKVLYKYTKVGGNRLKEDAKLLNLIGAKEEDRVVLEFWMKGLSLQNQAHN